MYLLIHFKVKSKTITLLTLFFCIPHWLFALFLFLVCLQPIHLPLLVTAVIENLVSWCDHLMISLSRLMDYRVRVPYSCWVRVNRESDLLAFFVCFIYLSFLISSQWRILCPVEWKAALWYLDHEFLCFCIYSWPVAKVYIWVYKQSMCLCIWIKKELYLSLWDYE